MVGRPGGTGYARDRGDVGRRPVLARAAPRRAGLPWTSLRRRTTLLGPRLVRTRLTPA
ncbi:hypothetical protein [Micromonospora fluostatini]|uniref:hypothetical protein n=1 Tax=Micromonospora sp. JCM 30529 TaxID=3421643 RepID=UPI003D164A7B